MKIRIEGTKEECLKLADDLSLYYDIRSISEFYPNTRKNTFSKEGRMYIAMFMEYIDEKGTLNKI